MYDHEFAPAECFSEGFGAEFHQVRFPL
jgi:hypothetical protein